MEINLPEDRPAGPRRVPRRDLTKFINPYNFVSAPPRDTNGELGDSPPIGHDIFAENCYSGSIPIVLTTRTPLLLPDQVRAEPVGGGQPRRVGTRKRGRTADAPPLLAGSTVKGVLRSAYEAITNSRFGIVSEKHETPVVIRQHVDDARDRNLLPAVITGGPDANGNFTASIVRSLTPNPDAGRQPGAAVWVPNDLGTDLAHDRGIPPEALDSQEVEAWIHLQHHPRRPFAMWRVSDIKPPGLLGATARNPPDPGRNQPLAPVHVKGHLLWTHSSFPAGGGGKHDERLVVTAVLNGPATLDIRHGCTISAEVVARFTGVIESYRRVHKDEPATVLSTNYGSYVWDPDRWRPLALGRTLYAEVDQHQVTAIFPAIIGRERSAVSPLDMINRTHLLPAESIEDLSPADRVFGWVHPKASDAGRRWAYRGTLRVDPPQQCGDVTVNHNQTPVWLGILNGPKTEQYRFYTAQPPHGRRRNAHDGYREDGRLRGRKFYLPQPETFDDAAYWSPDGAPRGPQAKPRHREYLAAGEHHPEVTTAVKSWVPAGAKFTTTLWVHNLTQTELGALLWLLALPDAAVFGIGLGKPLGFGSTRIEADWTNVKLYSTEGLKERYRKFDASSGCLDEDDMQTILWYYDDEIGDSEILSLIRDEFLDAAMGYRAVAVHYPRVGTPGGQPSPPADRLYEWFVENERLDHPYSLPPLGTEHVPVLPYLTQE